MKNFSIVLLRPEIPHNTGAIGRVAVGLGVRLHLVKPPQWRMKDDGLIGHRKSNNTTYIARDTVIILRR